MSASGSLGSIVHASPGRIRLRVSRPYRTTETFAEVRRLLTGLPGVTAVETNPATGSVLIQYDPNTLEVARLLSLGSELGWISGDSGGAGVGSGAIDWRSQVSLSRVARGAALLGVAAIGAMTGPALGLSARVGSLSAAAAFVLLGRLGRRARIGSRLGTSSSLGRWQQR